MFTLLDVSTATLYLMMRVAVLIDALVEPTWGAVMSLAFDCGMIMIVNTALAAHCTTDTGCSEIDVYAVGAGQGRCIHCLCSHPICWQCNKSSSTCTNLFKCNKMHPQCAHFSSLTA